MHELPLNLARGDILLCHELSKVGQSFLLGQRRVCVEQTDMKLVTVVGVVPFHDYFAQILIEARDGLHKAGWLNLTNHHVQELRIPLLLHQGDSATTISELMVKVAAETGLAIIGQVQKQRRAIGKLLILPAANLTPLLQKLDVAGIEKMCKYIYIFIYLFMYLFIYIYIHMVFMVYIHEWYIYIRYIWYLYI